VSRALADLRSTLKLLADPVRLRLCGVLARAELAVQELCAVTGLAQSRTSNQLAQLRRAGLVRDRREGTGAFHALVEPSATGPLSPALYDAVLRPYLESAESRVDAKALAAVRERRRQKSRDAHDRLAARWVEVGQEFAVGSLRAEVLAQAWPPGLVVADLGCGTGFLSTALAHRGARVIAVDHSARMLAAARKGPLGRGVEFRRGELDALPLADGEVDAAFSNLVWHHLPDVAAAAREVFRVVKRGGTVVVSDLEPHQADWMRETMGDLRLGTRPDQVVAALARAGFADLRHEPAIDRYRVTSPRGETRELPMFLVCGRKPSG
jgi:ArsR family transcriptional regulator